MMNQIVDILPEIHEKNGEFKRSRYKWLASPWPSESWEIRDPINPVFENSKSINFNCIVGPGETLLDYPDLLEDIKKSIAMAVQLHNRLYDRNLTFKAMSVSSIVRYGYSLMRIYREIMEIGLGSPSELDEKLVVELRQNLARPEHVSRRYAARLGTYLESVPLSEIPTQISANNRKVSGVKQRELALAVGITEITKCYESLALVKSANRQLQEQYPGLKFNTELSETEYDPDQTSEKQVKDCYRILSSLYQQSLATTDLTFPLKVDPFLGEYPTNSADKILKTVMVRQSAGRTPDIPIPVYLTLLDAAARWVVDYANELFELDRMMRENSEHNKAQNRRVRELTARSDLVGKVASPFPLGFFRQHTSQTKASKYSIEFLAAYQTYLDDGLRPRERRKLTGLNESQCVYVERILSDYYSQNIKHTGISLNYALYGILPFCCALLLLCFTAGRESSIRDLRVGCIRYVAGLRYINLYIPKTVRDYEDLPTCALVERAVSVLERLTEESRARDNHNLLFNFNDLQRNFKVRTIRFENVAERFMEFIDLEKDENGKHWELDEHQFRRAFAMMYFYRYGSDHEVRFNSLMHYLRHDDWAMTSRYLTQQKQGAVFRQIEEEWLAGILLAGKSNDPDLASLSSLTEGVQGSAYKTKLVRPREAKRALEKVQEYALVVELLSFGAVCLGLSPGRAEKANCLIRDNGQSLAAVHKASESLCEGCPNLVRCSSLVRHKTPERERLTHLACDSPILHSVIASGGLSE